MKYFSGKTEPAAVQVKQSNISQRRNDVAVYSEKRRNVGSVSGVSEMLQCGKLIFFFFFLLLGLLLRVKSESTKIHTAALK